MDKTFFKYMETIIDSQIQADKPQCTRAAFVRLLKSGHSDEEAKKKIAEILGKEMLAMTEGGQPFNDDRYAEELSKLGI